MIAGKLPPGGENRRVDTWPKDTRRPTALAGPLEGIRVVDLTTSIAGPYCTLILAALGADVLKVERPPHGDDTRAWGPPFWDGESVTFLAMNAGKRSLLLDVTSERGRRTLFRLVEHADVFVQNLRPGLAERLGYGPAALAEHNPSLVYCSIGAFGNRGPLATQPGYDPLVQAFAGIMSVTGEPGRPSVRAGASIIDQGAGMWATIGILAALRQRDHDGHGRTVDTSLYEVGLGWLPYQIAGTLATGVPPGPHGSGISILAPHEAFDAIDGRLMISAGNDRMFGALCEALELPSLAADRRFATNADRVQNRDELTRLIAERTRTLHAADVLERLVRARVPCAPIQDLAQVVSHPQTEALEMIQPVPHPSIADLRLVGIPLSLDGSRVPLAGPPPRLGETHMHRRRPRRHPAQLVSATCIERTQT